ncbi:DUF1499 domain-containing protein [Marimonas arenosa]|uniref:DUF1499 domain-containing protein n=1 Tax=Marimonas arenosa TaxID=1795305 RepID=A0AAE3WER4_9RHOB|nr:DUF1499 domain-containing protein [Marimonas arenosa]MDQ2091274.1 DUF1499 domain-containing protein [Marimonas arenosa]
MWIFAVVLVAVLLTGAYVRLAPSDPARWHVSPKFDRDRNFANAAVRVIDDAPTRLARLDAIAQDWPRTRTLAGSVGVGMITYVSRSALWGFPDYTTVHAADGKIVLWARSRFGRGDAGVNRERLEAWLAILRGEDL